MENNNFTSKNLIKVLNRFLMPNFHLKSDTYMELLISHLAKPENKGQIHTSDHWPVHLQVLQFKAYFYRFDATAINYRLDQTVCEPDYRRSTSKSSNLCIYTAFVGDCH